MSADARERQQYECPECEYSGPDSEFDPSEGSADESNDDGSFERLLLIGGTAAGIGWAANKLMEVVLALF